MTPARLRKIRKKLGLSAFQLGRAFGHEGSRNTVQVTVFRYESGARDLPPTIARLAEMFDRFGVPDDFLKPPPTDPDRF